MMMAGSRLIERALHGVGHPRTRIRGRFRIQGVMEENEDWFTRSAKWIKRSPLILGGSGFAFVLLNRLAYGVRSEVYLMRLFDTIGSCWFGFWNSCFSI